MGSRSNFKSGHKSRRSSGEKRRSSMTGRARCTRFECLEPRQMLSSQYPFLVPAQVREAYGINQINFGSVAGDGSHQTIAIIDSGDDPNMLSDLDSFDTTFAANMPASFTRPASQFLTITGENGSRPLYPPITGAVASGGSVTITTNGAHGLVANDWITITGFANDNFNGYYEVTAATTNTFTYADPSATGSPTGAQLGKLDNPVDSGETAMDVEWAHAIAPGANILLVEASGGLYPTEVANAANWATGAGAHVVSMSFGGGEFVGENDGSTTTLDDGLFIAPNVSYVGATGDFSAPGNYPAFSPNVLAAGATNLNVNPDGSYLSETGWSSPGTITGASEVPDGAGYLVTIDTANATGLSPGNSVTIFGVGPGYDTDYSTNPSYGAPFTVISSSSDSFTYFASEPGSVAITPSATIANAVDDSSGTVTITTTAPNGLSNNEKVRISGVGAGLADQRDVSGYNGVFTITVTSPTTFTYSASAGMTSPASGGTVVSSLAFGYFNLGNAGGSGGGISQDEPPPQPAYQQGTVTKVTQSTTLRTIPDVSMLGGGATPVEIYDSYDKTALESDLAPGGGTSLSTPCLAGLVAVADQGLAAQGQPPLQSSTVATNSDGVTGATLQTALYDSPLSDFHDITTGYNGYNAGPGYDLVTGIGTPKANLLVPTLAGTSIDYTVPTTDSPHALVLVRDSNFYGFDDGAPTSCCWTTATSLAMCRRPRSPRRTSPIPTVPTTR